MLLDTLLLTLATTSFVVCILLLAQHAIGAPFVPSHKKAVAAFVLLAKKGDLTHVVDLGSGSGTLLIALASAGITCHGVEINPVLAWISRGRLRRRGLHRVATVSVGNFWKHNLSQYDGVVLYGLTHIMKPLQQKITKELQPGSTVLSLAFRFPDWEPVETVDAVHNYQM